MPQDPQQIYYMVIDEKQAGPFTLDEIINHSNLTPETLVWKPGYDNWIAAKNFPELFTSFARMNPTQENITPPNFHRNPEYNNISEEGTGFKEDNFNRDNEPYQGNNSQKVNEPYDGSNGNRYNQNPYQNSHQQNYDERNDYNRFVNNPQYQSNHSYNNQNRYSDRQQNHYHQHPYQDPYQNRNGYQSGIHTNWLPWAIVATVVGFFTSCIGAIFGIIAIVQANKANNFYAQRFDREGDAANSNAKIMTIIGLIFAGIGIAIYIFFGSFFSNFANLAYY